MIKARIFVCLSLLFSVAACSDNRHVHQGYVEGEYVYVASPFGGRLDSLMVKRGQTVDAGTGLFALDAVEEAAAKLQAQRQYEAAIAQLADMQTGKRPLELDVVRAQLAQAIALEKQSFLQYQRDQAQLTVGAISQEQLEQSRATQENNAARVRELRKQIESDQLPAREEQIHSQNRQMEAARAALQQAEWRLDQKTQSSAQSGFIQDTLYREGEWVPAGNPVVKMLPPQNVKVRFFVPQGVMGNLKVGQQVFVQCDGCQPDLSATITFISTEAEFTPPVIFSNDTKDKLVFMVEAYPSPAQATSLHPGQPVEVRPQ